MVSGETAIRPRPRLEARNLAGPSDRGHLGDLNRPGHRSSHDGPKRKTQSTRQLGVQGVIAGGELIKKQERGTEIDAKPGHGVVTGGRLVARFGFRGDNLMGWLVAPCSMPRFNGGPLSQQKFKMMANPSPNGAVTKPERRGASAVGTVFKDGCFCVRGRGRGKWRISNLGAVRIEKIAEVTAPKEGGITALAGPATPRTDHCDRAATPRKGGHGRAAGAGKRRKKKVLGRPNGHLFDCLPLFGWVRTGTNKALGRSASDAGRRSGLQSVEFQGPRAREPSALVGKNTEIPTASRAVSLYRFSHRFARRDRVYGFRGAAECGDTHFWFAKSVARQSKGIYRGPGSAMGGKSWGDESFSQARPLGTGAEIDHRGRDPKDPINDGENRRRLLGQGQALVCRAERPAAIFSIAPFGDMMDGPRPGVGAIRRRRLVRPPDFLSDVTDHGPMRQNTSFLSGVSYGARSADRPIRLGEGEK